MTVLPKRVQVFDNTLDQYGRRHPDQTFPTPDKGMTWRGVPSGRWTFQLVLVVVVFFNISVTVCSLHRDRSGSLSGLLP